MLPSTEAQFPYSGHTTNDKYDRKIVRRYNYVIRITATKHLAFNHRCERYDIVPRSLHVKTLAIMLSPEMYCRRDTSIIVLYTG